MLRDRTLAFNTALLTVSGLAMRLVGMVWQIWLVSRIGGDKLLEDLAGEPVLIRALRPFQQTEAIREIVVVTREDRTEQIAGLCRWSGIGKLTACVPGGDTRTRSSLQGVMALSPQAELVAVHDGARPLVTEQIILDALWAAYRHTAAAPAVPVRDTVKVAREGMVISTPDRTELFAMQTPQCFQRDILAAALQDASANAPEVTDDCMAVERIGGRVALSAGSEENIKITTPLDLELARIILGRRERS